MTSAGACVRGWERGSIGDARLGWDGSRFGSLDAGVRAVWVRARGTEHAGGRVGVRLARSVRGPLGIGDGLLILLRQPAPSYPAHSRGGTPGASPPTSFYLR
jgi:hypothetical protein